MGSTELSLHNLLTHWQWSPFPLFMLTLLVAVAIWYLRADWALAALGRRWSGWRTTAFFAGLVCVDLALQSSIASFAGIYFQDHVVQHLLLMAVAPPLLALGAPSTLLLQTTSRRTKMRFLAVLRSRPAAVLSHPVAAWFGYFGIMYAFFLTPLINIAMHHMALMDLLNLTFLFGGMLYWWPMVGIDPIAHWKMGYGARMLNILLGSGVEAFLGVEILGSTKPIASMYTVASTRSGGGLLWATTELITIGAFIPIFVKWMQAEERVAARADKAAARAVALADDEGAAIGRLTPWEAEWLARTGSVPRIGGDQVSSFRPVSPTSQVSPIAPPRDRSHTMP